jgi:hypothetical protein
MGVENVSSGSKNPIASLSRDCCLRAPQVGAAMMGLAGPFAVGVLAGHAEMGMAAALGGLALSTEGKGQTTRERTVSLFYRVIAGTAAMVTGVAIARHGMSSAFAIPVVAMVAVLLGSISRPLARASTIFIAYTIIATGFGARGAHPFGIAFLFFLGAAWTAGLSLILRAFFRAICPVSIHFDPDDVAYPQNRTAKQLLRRWRNSLAHLSGWQYPIRIFVCLIAAQAVEWIWPLHHGYWVGLTVAIVVHRDLKMALGRTLQRAVGTVLGVLFASLLVLWALPAWAIIAIVVVLAATRPILREIDYTVYATLHTPLIILLSNFGHEQSWTVIIDRLVATIAGCVIAVTLGYFLWFKLLAQTRLASESKTSRF